MDVSNRAVKIEVAIIGCGMMGQEHASYLRNYSDVNLRYVVDPSSESIATLVDVVGEGHTPTSLLEEELLERASEIDLLVIATPNYLHTPALLRWGSMPITILVEKPVAVSLEQVCALRDAKKDFKANIWVAMEYRFIPAIQKLIQLIPHVGKLKAVTIRENRYPFLSKVGQWNKDRNKSGDTLVEKCCHFFDLFRLITKQDLRSCTTKIQRGLLNTQYEYDDSTDNPIIDSAYVLLDFEDNDIEQIFEENGTEGLLNQAGASLASPSTDSEATAGHISLGESVDVDLSPHETTSKNGKAITNKAFQQATMGCLELCMFAEGSRHQEEIVVTGMQGRLEAYLPENKVFMYQRPLDEAWPDKSKPPPPESIREQIFECSDMSAVYPFANEIPNHAGYHYCSTAVEWKYLLDAVKEWRDDPTKEFVPKVSLEDGLKAVEWGILAMNNVHSPVEHEYALYNTKIDAPISPGLGGYLSRKRASL